MPNAASDRLNAAQAGMLRRGGPIPLVGLLTAVAGWFEERHIELLAEAGFDDVRRAHNAVMIHLSADGIRLTELAERAGMSKQAMAELVADLVAKGYLDRVPDPTDRRAKLIVIRERGDAAHRATLEIFARIEDELADVVGVDALESTRATLTEVLERVVLGRAPGAS